MVDQCAGKGIGQTDWHRIPRTNAQKQSQNQTRSRIPCDRAQPGNQNHLGQIKGEV